MNSELHLFIIWKNARIYERRIIKDISKDFEIVRIIEIKWDKLLFAKNLSRFYGIKLTMLSFKERECGNGSFLLVIVRDKKPQYGKRLTTRGNYEIVNVNMFDKKTLYRSWFGENNSKVHCTNSVQETAHDLMLLLGMDIDEFERKAETFPDSLDANIVGTFGWMDLRQVFKVLNATTEYLVLRNFEYLPDKYVSKNHGDIDLLVANEKETAQILNAKKVYWDSFRVHYACKINGESVRFDFRHIGDNYYCETWEKNMLSNRLRNTKGFYIADAENYKFSLLYHALIHKNDLSVEYSEKLSQLFSDQQNYLEQLNGFLHFHNYEITEPNDLSVVINSDNSGLLISNKRRKYQNCSSLKMLINKCINIVRRI